MKRAVAMLAVGVVLLLVGAVVFPFFVVLPRVLPTFRADQFKVPGTFEATVKAPGRHYLWNDFRTVFDGKVFDGSEQLPHGLQIRVWDGSGRQVPFITDTSTSSWSNDGSKESIGYVNVEKPGSLKIEVTGGGGERIFSFSRFELAGVMGWILGGTGLSLVTCLSGIGLVVWGLFRAARTGRKARASVASGG